MAWLCRMCAGDNAGPSVSLLHTSQHHLQWAINHFDIKLDNVLPTSVCLRCNAIILKWTLFLGRRKKATSLFSTMIVINVPPSPVPGTERLQEPRQLTSRPNTPVPSKSSGHCAASAPDMSLPHHLVTEYHNKDFTIKTKLLNQGMAVLKQNGTVDCNVVDNQMSEQRNVRIKQEPVTMDPSVCINQVSDNLQPKLSSTVVDDEIEVPFEAINDPILKYESDLIQTKPGSGLSADQSENHHLAAVTVKHGKIGNEADSDVHLDLLELATSAEISNSSSNKDVNISSPLFICAQCDFTTNCKSKIRSHIVNQHVKMSRYQCRECSKNYKYKIALRRHIGHAHPNKYPYKCLLCKQGFQLERSFNAHLKYHVKTLQCDVCGKILSSKHSLTKHKMAIHTKSSPLSCNICSKIFYTESSLKQHARRVHSNLYRCDICDKLFKSKLNLLEHQRDVHDSVPAFSCNQCENTFVSKCRLKRHSVVHTDLHLFKCDKCNSCFKIKSHLLFHIRTVHSNVRPFKCHVCSKCFKYKCNLTQHLLRHTDAHNFTCEQCGKQFKTIADLKGHFLIHSEIRPFACAQCPRKFNTKANLAQHLCHAHSDLRPFSCDKCPYACKSIFALKVHQLVHSKERKIECPHCQSKFKLRKYLSVHIKIKHSNLH